MTVVSAPTDSKKASAEFAVLIDVSSGNNLSEKNSGYLWTTTLKIRLMVPLPLKIA